MIEEIKIDRLEELIHEMMIKIRDTYPTNSAEGNPIEIENAAAAPLVKCVTAITGSQSGSGTPSPDNVRPITAYSSGSVEVEDEDANSVTYATTFRNAIYEGTEDVVSGKVTAKRVKIVFDGSVDEEWAFNDAVPQFFISLPSGYSTTNAISNIFDCKLSSSPGVYVLRATDALLRVKVTQDFLTEHSISDVETWMAWLEDNNMEIVCDVNIKTTETVSNAPISSVHGYNKIESSTGDMEVTYITEEFEPLVPTT